MVPARRDEIRPIPPRATHHPPHATKMNKLEAVTVCVGYADFLGVVAEANRHLFDRWVIVTTPGDNEGLPDATLRDAFTGQVGKVER